MAGEFAGGTVLTIGSAISELTSISGPTISLDVLDVTSHDSADQFREFVAGLADGGEISVEGNFIDAAQANILLALLVSRDVTTGATIVFPNTEASTWTFDCFVTGYESSEPFDDKLSFTATLKITGKPVMAAATT